MADDGGVRIRVLVYEELPMKLTCTDPNCKNYKIDKDRASVNIAAFYVIEDTPGCPKARNIDPDAELPPGTQPVYMIKEDFMNCLYETVASPTPREEFTKETRRDTG